MKTALIATYFVGLSLGVLGAFFVVEQVQRPSTPTPPLVMQGNPADHERENREAFQPVFAADPNEDVKVDWRTGW